MTMRFHTQTGGVTLTAQQPINNIVRVALQAFAAVCGGTQSLHTNGYDEALALPSERAAKIALRTQQIVAHESGAADTVDPFAGSYFVEALTDEIERRARVLIDRVDELGGSVEAIGFIKNEIEESAFGYHERYRTGQDVVVGVNRYEEDDAEVEEILRVDPAAERAQVERLRRSRRAATRAGRAAARGAAGGLPRGREPAAADPRRRSRTRARSARSAARCARSSASTSPPMSRTGASHREPVPASAAVNAAFTRAAGAGQERTMTRRVLGVLTAAVSGARWRRAGAGGASTSRSSP